MSKFASEMFAQSLKTREKLTSMVMSGKGWNTGTLNGECLGEPQTCLYAKDVATGWIWMCSMPRTSFSTISRKASKASDADVTAIRGGAGSLIRQLADGQVPPIRESLTSEEQLALILASYMGTTQCWQLADQMRTKGSALILHYRQPGAADGMLRPGVIPSNDILPADTVLQYFHDVEALDRSKHPEWFK